MKPFILSVKVIIINSNGRCLLLKRSLSSQNNPGKWDLPGGKIEQGEAFTQALLREVMEETGLDVQLIGLTGSILSESVSHNIVNVVMTGQVGNPSVLLSPEHEEFGWYLPSDILPLDIVPHFRKMLFLHFSIIEDQNPAI